MHVGRGTLNHGLPFIYPMNSDKNVQVLYQIAFKIWIQVGDFKIQTKQTLISFICEVMGKILQAAQLTHCCVK